MIDKNDFLKSSSLNFQSMTYLNFFNSFRIPSYFSQSIKSKYA